ncbi:WecB/TagA/CpsF family glycosyltransferase [Chlorogloeopsis sp. ULAP02]|uniref:WecB/TagA/CpsF family glycosyltransferase n=1 Tax=Chlorogloeopsis sp. ULAP02 TaxID=3107926 RepID=UPI003134A257
MKRVRVLNIEITNLTLEEVLQSLKSGIVFTPNVDHLIRLQHDCDFFNVYNIADYKLCDSKILIYASRFLGKSIQERIAGSDFFPAFCNYHKDNHQIKIFLLGGVNGVAAIAQERINSKLERNIVVDSYSPSWGFENNEQECQKIIELINSSGATVLAVGVGSPKQEKWIYKYRNQLPNVKIFMAIGTTINFEAGKLKRAPKWMREVGLEWLYRLVLEPKRLWKRYLIDDIPFFWLILKQRLNLYKMPFVQKHISELYESS